MGGETERTTFFCTTCLVAGFFTLPTPKIAWLAASSGEPVPPVHRAEDLLDACGRLALRRLALALLRRSAFLHELLQGGDLVAVVEGNGLPRRPLHPALGDIFFAQPPNQPDLPQLVLNSISWF